VCQRRPRRQDTTDARTTDARTTDARTTDARTTDIALAHGATLPVTGDERDDRAAPRRA
jgi:hypothetical protein